MIVLGYSTNFVIVGLARAVVRRVRDEVVMYLFRKLACSQGAHRWHWDERTGELASHCADCGERLKSY